MTTKKPKPKEPPKEAPDYLAPGEAAKALAAQIEAATTPSSEDEPAERLVLRVPLKLMRGIEKLALQAGRSRNYMAVQLILAGFDGVLAALPEDKRDDVLLACLVEEEE